MIAEMVRQARQSKGISTGQMVDRMGWFRSELSGVENGTRRCEVDELVLYLAMCDADRETMARVVGVHRQWGDTMLVHGHDSGLPDTMWALLNCEKAATAVAAYDPVLIPGLLQTQAYVHALLLGADVDPEKIDDRVRDRMARQQVMFEASPPRFEFFVPEAGLRAVVGSREVMSEQLMYMVLLSNRDGIDIRVLPSGISGSAWLRGQFEFMNHDEYPAVVHVELDTASVLVDDRGSVDCYRDRIRRLREAALDKARSRALMLDMAHEYKTRTVKVERLRP
ncbi:helix-turn-helix domain-containing protein [Saccharothrix violaceirubra]|uniref:DUF5753 domain-containing protein n=1 Tax=Saccharothrix violaceirubra TaxID=413306 RepID=A0A7W7SXG0_9PSEU|nr:helix-turn-helix transcriptional regulator [Saccharothrix violaceirubra]MBB4962684.1 hypothetical protein [Saccharothrix violaceirubra]